jgi:hypothetical protein
MRTTYQFDGIDIFLGVEGDEFRTHVYRGSMLGVYWADHYGRRSLGRPETEVLVQDDFGNLVKAFSGAHQRAAFRQVLH